MKDYLTSFLNFDRQSIRWAIFLNFACAATEGIGIFMLIPLLSLTGIGDSPSQSQNQIQQFLISTGVHWNIALVLTLFVVLIAIQSQIALHKDRISQKLQLKFTDHLRKKLYLAVIEANWEFISNQHSAEILNTITTEIQRINTGTYFLLRFIAVSILACAYVLVALYVSMGLTGLSIAIGLGLWVILRQTDNIVSRGGMLLTQANRQMVDRIQDFLHRMKLIKLHNQETKSAFQFNHVIEQISQHTLQFQYSRTKTQAVYKVGGAIALASISYSGLIWFHLTIPQLLVLIAIFTRMLPQLSEFQIGRQQLLHMLPAFKTWKNLLNACHANTNHTAHHADGILTLSDGIQFEHIVYKHNGSPTPLQIKNLFIPANTTTLITGASGAGKTTFLDLLSGLIKAQTGHIKIDQQTLQSHADWQHNTAYITQDHFIFNGSIRENITWGTNNPSEDEINLALRHSGLLDFTYKQTEKLETLISEKGTSLSGGEKQRLAIARALLMKPKLLILDEATNALDEQNQQIIYQALECIRGKITIVLVAHQIQELLPYIDGVVEIKNSQTRKLANSQTSKLAN